MAKFAYNNAKNTRIGYTSFKLNCEYHSCIFYKEKEILDFHLKSKTVEELSSELQELMTICKQNLYYTQKFQK